MRLVSGTGRIWGSFLVSVLGSVQVWVVVSLARKRLHSARTHSDSSERDTVAADRRTPVVMRWTLWHLQREERNGTYDKIVRGKPLFAIGILKFLRNLLRFLSFFLPLSALSIVLVSSLFFHFSPLLATVRVKAAIAWQAEVLVEEREKERGEYAEQDGESLEWGEDLSDRLAPPLPPWPSCIYCFPAGSSLDLPCRFWSVFTWIWPVYAVNHSREEVVLQYANEGRAVYVRTLSVGVLSWSSATIPLFWKEIRLLKMKGLRVFDYPPFWICCGGNPTEAAKW